LSNAVNKQGGEEHRSGAIVYPRVRDLAIKARMITARASDTEPWEAGVLAISL